MQVRSSVRLMTQIQPSGRGLLLSPTAWSPDQHLVAMLADVSRHMLGRTEGRGLGFGQLVRTHTGKCLKCQFSSDWHSKHSALCAGGRLWSAGPAPVSKLGQGVPDIHRFLSSMELGVEKCLGLSVGDRVLCLWSLTVDFLSLSALSFPVHGSDTPGQLCT